MPQNDDRINKIGQRIRQLRLQKGLRQRELAGGELTKSFISQVERGQALPSLVSFVKIADRLEVPVSSLLEDGNNPKHLDLLIQLRLLEREICSLRERVQQLKRTAIDRL